MVKSSWIAISFMLALSQTIQGQSGVRYVDSTVNYCVQLELGPIDVSYAADVFAVCTSANSIDTLGKSNRRVCFRESIPQVLSVAVFVQIDSSTLPLKWVVFDSLTSTTEWLLPILDANQPDSLFLTAPNENILMVPQPVNSITALEMKPFLRIKYGRSVWYSVSSAISISGTRLYNLGPWDPSVFVFKNPWIAPDR